MLQGLQKGVSAATYNCRPFGVEAASYSGIKHLGFKETSEAQLTGDALLDWASSPASRIPVPPAPSSSAHPAHPAS